MPAWLVIPAKDKNSVEFIFSYTGSVADKGLDSQLQQTCHWIPFSVQETQHLILLFLDSGHCCLEDVIILRIYYPQQGLKPAGKVLPSHVFFKKK